MTTTTIRTLDTLDRALAAATADRAAQIRAQRIAKADPFAHVTGVDDLGAPILDPSAPDLCENR
jgi:uncharacterized protein YkwD